MAATGKTPILLYGSTTATNQPSAGNLTNSSDGCEIAINVADKNLFFKDSTNAVNTVPIRQSSGSSDGWLSSANWTTFNSKQAALVSGTNIKTVNGTSLLGSGDVGTINVGYGGTGLTSVTAGYIPFGNSASALSTSSSFVWDNTHSRLGIGFSTPNEALEIAGYPNATIRLSDSGSNYYNIYRAASDGYLHLYGSQSGAIGYIFGGADGETMRIHASRGVSIGNTTDPGAGNLNVNTKMWVGTTSNVSGNATITSQAAASQSALVLGYSTAARMADFNNNGNLYLDIVNANTTASAANVYIDPTYAVMQRSTSSIKYKKNVQDATFGLDDVMKLRPVTYQGVGKFDSELTFGGLIAEEVDAAGLNMFVQYAEDGSPDSLAYGNMVAMAFKAIQQQQAMIVELQNKIAILENK